MIKLDRAALAAFSIVAMAASAAAQGYDGSYAATIRCTGFEGTEIGPLSQAMSLKIAGATVTGERAVGRPNQVGASGVTEKWTGTVAPDGTLAVETLSASQHAPISGSFTGRATRAGLSLSGTQTMSTSRRGKVNRSCTVAAKR